MPFHEYQFQVIKLIEQGEKEQGNKSTQDGDASRIMNQQMSSMKNSFKTPKFKF